MQFILFFTGVLLSAVISSFLTVILLRRYLVDSVLYIKGSSKNSNTVPHIAEKQPVEVDNAISKMPTLDSGINTKNTLFESLMEGEKTRHPFLFFWFRGVFKKLFKNKMSLNKTFRPLLVFVVSFFIGLFEYLILLAKIFVHLPAIFVSWIYADITYFISAFACRTIHTAKKISNFFGTCFQFVYNSSRDLLYSILTKQGDNKKTHETKDRGMEVKSITNTENALARYSPVDENHTVFENKNHFFLEAVGIFIFSILIFSPFVSKAQEFAPGYFFFYHIAVLFFGSYVLLKRNSPRVFWAIGIMEWVSVFLWFFNWYKDAYILSATIFLTIFVCIYGFSSYLWYGIKDREYVTIEYALFMLHPFLYLSAIYLLLIETYKYIVGGLFVLVASLYIGFARNLYKEDKTKDILYICLFVASIAVLSSISVLLSGIYLLVGLSLLGVWLLWFSDFYQVRTTLYVIPILIYSIGYTLSSTNTAKNFLLFVNERFFGYMVTVATLLFVSTYIRKLFKKNNSAIYKYVYAASLWFACILFVIAVTLDLMDAKLYTDVLRGVRADIARAVFYIACSVFLYLKGSRDNSKSILVASVSISIYTIVYIFGTFLF